MNNSRFAQLARPLLRIVPGKWIGHLEFLSGDHRRFFPWGGAMNGHTARLEITRCLIEKLKIARIIETGTFRGTTTEWFASFGLPVETIEVSPRFHAFARKRLQHFPNVHVHLGESTGVLRELVPHLADKAAPTFFYLDAHWHDYLPLAEELEIIFSSFPDAYVMIDDFQVPDDEGYGYDDYSADKQLTLHYVREHFREILYAFFPAARSEWETGTKRGCVVLTDNDASAQRLREIPGLRAWS